MKMTMQDLVETIHFEKANSPSPDYPPEIPNELDPDGDDEDGPCPPDVKAILGFDPDELDVEDEEETEAKQAATDKLIDTVLERLTGVSAEWLGGVKPTFAALMDMAEDPGVSDESLAAALAQASKIMPRLFDKMKPEALAKAMGDAMGAAAVNGAVAGFLKRKA